MIIHNATVVTFDGENRVIEDGAVRYHDATIDSVGHSLEVLAKYPSDERWDAAGLLLMPGQICAHTHFYGAFARGMYICLLYTSPSPRDRTRSRMPSSA